MLSGSWATLTSRQFSGCLQCDKLVFRGHVRGVAWLATLKTTFSLGTLAFGQNNCHCWAQLQGPGANIPQGLPVNSSHGEIVSRQLYHTSQFVTVNSSQPHGQFVAPVKSSHQSIWHMANLSHDQCQLITVLQCDGLTAMVHLCTRARAMPAFMFQPVPGHPHWRSSWLYFALCAQSILFKEPAYLSLVKNNK